MVRLIRENRFVSGIYRFFRDYFGVSKRKFGYYGEKVHIINPTSISHPQNVYLYGNNGLNHAVILTKNARFIMKPNSGAAYGLKVITGNHARIVGIPYRNITEDMKPEGLDKDVIVESDVWIGTDVTLLSGVTVGRGTTVAAGAVVTKSLPPYCVCGGVPARVIRRYWTIEQILEHESKIYSKEERYTREQLEEIYSTVLPV